MKYITTVLLLVLVFSFFGCSQGSESVNWKAAIEKAMKLENVEAQVKYLVKEANAFVNNEKFDDAIKTAQHILNNLDSDSLEAKSIIETVQVKVKEMAEKKMGEVAGDLQNKLGNLGK